MGDPDSTLDFNSKSLPTWEFDPEVVGDLVVLCISMKFTCLTLGCCF